MNTHAAKEATPALLAAVDLGSNSFRMEVGRVVGSQIYPLDSLREPVRLASGLSHDKVLDTPAFERGLQALERFGERLRGFPVHSVRAVATNTLRVARNAAAFVAEAEARLGFPIEVIAGREEARLIYFGVAHLQEPGTARRLVIDIGGGSTELIVGQGYRPEVLESLYLGCVSHSMRYFADGRYDRSAFREAELAARREFEVVSRQARKLGWSEVIGSSGTARALADLLEQNGLSDHGITRKALEQLRSILIKAGSSTELRLVGLRSDRVPVLAGGLAIMFAAFDELDIEHLQVSDGALRTGVLYDLLGRVRHEDMRDTTIREFGSRYGVDESQAQRVSALAKTLWQGLAPGLPSFDDDPTTRLIAWAAALHEIGLSIAHNGYHKHSAYILNNADMPGFSRREQAELASLVLGHTGKLGKMREALDAGADPRPFACLRLAAVIYRSRGEVGAPAVRLKYEKSRFRLSAKADWIRRNPLTNYDLRQEVNEWERIGLALDIDIDT